MKKPTTDLGGLSIKDNPTINKEPKSKCCGAKLEVVNGGDGTSYWICGSCKNPSDPAPNFKEENPKLSDEWAETCIKCGRRSNVVALSKECPFCNPTNNENWFEKSPEERLLDGMMNDIIENRKRTSMPIFNPHIQNEGWQDNLYDKIENRMRLWHYDLNRAEGIESLYNFIQSEIDKARDNNCTIHKLKNIWCLVCAAEIADNARKEAVNATILKLKGEIKNYGSDGDLVGHLLDTISSRLSEPKN